jgi:hypothetical protein
MINWLRRLDARHSNFLFLIGAMKCGTTSLAGVLAKHPKVFGGSFKEPNFFAEKGSKLASERDYLESFPLRKAIGVRGKWFLDASTSYTKYPTFGDAAGAIEKFTSRAKFIYLVRDPIARIESQLAHAYNRDPSFVKRYESRRLKEGFYQNYLRVSSYASQLDRYAGKFGEDKILVLDFDELIQAPEETVGKVWSFLNLEPMQNVSLGHRNARKDKKVPQSRLLPMEMEPYLREQLVDDMAALQATWGIDPAKWGF